MEEQEKAWGERGVSRWVKGGWEMKMEKKNAWNRKGRIGRREREIRERAERAGKRKRLKKDHKEVNCGMY